MAYDDEVLFSGSGGGTGGTTPSRRGGGRPKKATKKATARGTFTRGPRSASSSNAGAKRSTPKKTSSSNRGRVSIRGLGDVKVTSVQAPSVRGLSAQQRRAYARSRRLGVNHTAALRTARRGTAR